jgi:hypothetical protein
MLPFAVAFALLPGQIAARLAIAGCLLAAALGLGFATSGRFRDRRLVQHGLPAVARTRTRKPTEDEILDAAEAARAAEAQAAEVPAPDAPAPTPAPVPAAPLAEADGGALSRRPPPREP